MLYFNTSETPLLWLSLALTLITFPTSLYIIYKSIILKHPSRFLGYLGIALMAFSVLNSQLIFDENNITAFDIVNQLVFQYK
jgi:hypothetical protein